MDCNIYPKEVIAQSSDANKILKSDLPFHQWYRFVLSFPPHLVRQYLAEFSPRGPVLDPFCGTGTTLVECKRLGVHSVGMEANPMAAFASHVKTDWTPDPNWTRHSPLLREISCPYLPPHRFAVLRHKQNRIV
ncbi:MAG: hypothetical protein HUU60_05710 [Armatimonadetes bacterium]|nr:hypothetical protein [Armatimonadota bacterium]